MHEFFFEFVSGSDGLEKVIMQHSDAIYDVTQFSVEKIQDFMEQLTSHVESRLHLPGQRAQAEIRA